MQTVKLRDEMKRKSDTGGELTWNRVITAVVRLVGDDGRGAALP